MTWDYRLVKLNGKMLPRIAEVFYDEDGVIMYFDVIDYWKEVYLYTFPPLGSFFKQPVKEADIIIKKYEI